MKRLSLIIVTYQSEKDIYDCLQSVWEHCDIPKDELEIIVVDNSPQSDEMFKRLNDTYGSDITLIRNTHNGGYGQGNNVGIRRATAPVVMVMNPDVRLCEPVFKTALDAFAQDDRLCMYGMRQMLAENVKSPLSFDCSRTMNGYLIPLASKVCNKFGWYCPKSMYLQGSCFFIRKEKFIEAGLFDEDIFMYGEEDDIHWRMRQLFGPRFKYNGHLRYLHLALNRPMNLDTEMKMVSSTVAVHKKRGIAERQTVKNYIRYYRTRLFSAKVKRLLKGGGKTDIDILKAVICHIKSTIE
ncbi:MAG: glycosyltransferase [Prevotella sp.]|nr:glycosyltransferase [Prevotella sp.]